MPKPLPSPEMLRKLLRYEPDTGKLFWRERTPDMFRNGGRDPQWACNNWNSKFANKEAFASLDFYGYAIGRVFNVDLKAHRVIFAIHYGFWPTNQIDHINGVRSDNRIENLREVTNKENHRNMKINSNNSSGHMGIVWDKARKKWQSSIVVNGRNKHLGRFSDITDAIAARKAAEIKYGYHKNHGRD